MRSQGKPEGADFVYSEQTMALEQTLNAGNASQAQQVGAVEFAGLQDFDAVVRQYQRRIFRVLLAMVRDSDTAETLTQECFLNAYRSRATFRGEASVSTWLTRIAINLARAHHRSRKLAFWRKLTTEREDPAEVLPTIADNRVSAERGLLAKERLAAVWAAVDNLTPQQRTVFVLRFVEEMSLEQIAEATSLKIGTVKSHLFRAVDAVRRRTTER